MYDILQAIERLLSRQNLTRADREDITQTVVLRLLERLHEAPEDRVVILTTNAAFAVGITRNILREHRRGAQRRDMLERCFSADLADLYGSLTPPVDLALERRETLGRIAQAKRRLCERERWLVEARFIEDRAYADILPHFKATFGRAVRTEEGLRTALFHARSSLKIAFEAQRA